MVPVPSISQTFRATCVDVDQLCTLFSSEFIVNAGASVECEPGVVQLVLCSGEHTLFSSAETVLRE